MYKDISLLTHKLKFNSILSAIKIDKLFSLLFSFYKCGGLNFFL